MSLQAGARIGVYEIVDALGAGGMGEVYRARDTKLRREVAIKVLPEIFASDAERAARFQREAELLAALNHPNIAAVYGVDESSGATAIVMELVEGETLAEVIARGAVPLDDALPIARQIVDALEAAHDRGVVHRDLKPANIKITPDGKVKVLDFGLAKALEASGASGARGAPGGLTMSPTLSVHATYAGLILGTAAYMSPEQARGKPVDRRTDIWAFGCVLYEMLTGRQTFDAGDTVSDAVAAILKSEVDSSALPASTPPHIRRLLHRCLQKDPQKRLPHIGLVRIEIDDPPIEVAPPAVSSAARARWSPMGVLGVAAAALTIAAASAVIAWRLKPTPSATVTRFTIPVPQGQPFTNSGRRIVAISPDGTRIVYVANLRLYIRSMWDDQPHVIRGSDSVGPVVNPAFSPDGQHIAFFGVSDRALKRIAVGGGTPLTVATSANPYGVSWQGDYIYSGQGAAGIMRVRAAGGSPETIVKVAPGELAYGPQMLPDGDTVLFTLAAAVGGTDRWDKARVVAQSLGKGVRTTLIDGGSDGRYVPTGHLLYALGATVLAVPFDPSRLQIRGAPTPVLEGVRRTVPTPATQFDVSGNGTIAYAPSGAFAPGQQDLVVFDRQGTVNALRLPLSTYDAPRYSPDGRAVAYAASDGREESIWIYDLSRAASPRRLTIGGRGRAPLWSADGRHVIFQSDRDGTASLYWQRADGSGVAERLTTAESGTTHVPDSVSPDGRYLAFTRTAADGMTSWLYSFADKKAAPFADVRANALPTLTFSPNGRWVAYTASDISIQSLRIYLQPFPPTGAKYEIGGGIHPMWSADGKDVLFSSGLSNQMAAVSVTTEPAVSTSRPTLFPRPAIDLGPMNVRPFDIGPDGKIIGIANVTAAGDRADDSARTGELRVIVNWFEELKQRVPIK